MNANDLIKFYGSEKHASAALNVSILTLRNWGDPKGKGIPRFTQMAIQLLTKCKLKADRGCFK